MKDRDENDFRFKGLKMPSSNPNADSHPRNIPDGHGVPTPHGHITTPHHHDLRNVTIYSSGSVQVDLRLILDRIARATHRLHFHQSVCWASLRDTTKNLGLIEGLDRD